MNWLIEIFTEPSYIQAILVLSLICVAGLLCNKIKIKGVSLGVTFVFFAGIVVGHFGLSVDPRMLALAQNFGLVLFVWPAGRPEFLPFAEERRHQTEYPGVRGASGRHFDDVGNK